MIVNNKTTTHLTLPDPRRLWHLPVPISAAVVTFGLIAIAALVGRIQSTPAAAPQPVIIVQTAPAVVVPTAAPAQQVAAAPAGNVTRRAIVVYGAPDLTTAIGAVEMGRSYRLLARFGSDWLQVEVSDGTGIVYVRTSDVLGVSGDLVDLQPAAAPQVVYVPVSAPAPAYAPELPYQVTNNDQPAPQPPEQAPAAAPVVAAPAAAPPPAPAADHAMPASPPNDVQRALMQEAWRQEHCVGDVCR